MHKIAVIYQPKVQRKFPAEWLNIYDINNLYALYKISYDTSYSHVGLFHSTLLSWGGGGGGGGGGGSLLPL